MRRICNGVEYEGSPEELARFESLVERPQVTVNQQEQVRLASVVPSAPVQMFVPPVVPAIQVAQHDLTDEQRQVLYLSHSKEFVDKVEQAVIRFNAGSMRSMYKAMEQVGIDDPRGNDYRIFKKIYKLIFQGKPMVSRRGHLDFAGAVKYFKENPVSIFNALSKFGISAGRTGYEGFKAELKRAYPAEAKQLLEIRSRMYSRRGDIQEHKTEPHGAKHAVIPEGYLEACTYFMENKVSIHFTLKKFKLATTPMGCKLFKRYFKKQYPQDGAKVLKERKNVHTNKKLLAKAKLKPTDLRPAHARFVSRLAGELIKKGKSRKEAFIEASKAWTAEKAKSQGQQQGAPAPAQAPVQVQAPAQSPSPAKMPLLSPILPEDMHIAEEQIKFVIKEGFPLKREHLSTLRLIDGAWSDGAWNRCMQSFLIQSEEIARYLGIPNRFRLTVEEGEKVMRYIG